MSKNHSKQAYQKVFNIHDPHNQYAWSDERTPLWVTVLKVAALIAGGIGIAILWKLFTIIMFQLG